MRIVAFGTYDSAVHPRVAVLIAGLRAWNQDVVELNRPLGYSTAERVTLVQEPWRLPGFGLRLLRRWASLVRLGLKERRRGRPDAVLVGYLGHFDVVLARLVFGRVPIVLDHLVSASGTVLDRGLASRRSLRGRVMVAIDRLALACADVVVVDTAERVPALAEGGRRDVVVCPVGASDEWFAASGAAADRGVDEPLRAIFFGLFTPLQGATTIARAAALLEPDDRVEITLVGRGQDWDEARRIVGDHPAVRWIEWLEPADLIRLVATQDVCLGIFGTTAKAREVVPTKVFQGAAAGCAVVTSDTASQRGVLGDDAAYVPPGDAEALAAVLRELSVDRGRLDSLRERMGERAAREFTAAEAVRPMMSEIGGITPVEEE
ncbi:MULTISPECIES: glycosyltransferase family protein [Aeromicrobium]|uniref:glycosyltransferase family protein n=1 Tax=Aeromicrobium TaxID=2040 RepID=UPI00257A3D7B|nr:MULTISPECIES: glycosyltransferase [Aeromicrobium]